MQKSEKSKIKGYISAVKDDYIKESFKGEIYDEIIKWPKELGAKHPFNFVDVETIYKKFGLINGIINKIADSIVGEFTVNAKNLNVLALVKNFIKTNNFSVVLREWIKEGLLKGNGFMEIDLEEGKVRVLNANNMYVRRDKYGNVIEYTQYTGDINRINLRKALTFSPNQIAHLKINCISDEAYGIGLIWPNERVIDDIALMQKDSHKLIDRKAGAPLQVIIGQPGEVADTTAIDSFKTSLQYMNNRTEWVTDGNVQMKVIEFGEIGKNLAELMMHDFRMLIAGMDIPEVLLNSGQLNEGIAKVQLEGWQRRIISYQDMIEGVIIEKIINPYLESQKLKGEVDFVWNLPGEDEVNKRLQQLTGILGTFNLSENLKRIIELEVARLLNIQDAEKFLMKPAQEDMEKKAEGEIPQPEVPGAKPNATASLISERIEKKGDEYCVISHKTGKSLGCYKSKSEAEKRLGQISRFKDSSDFDNMSVREFINLREIKGFNYSDYLLAILKRVKLDKFEQLTAITEKDFNDGLLNENEINKLRTILKEGFRRNQSMNQIEENIRESIKLKDRITETGVVISASSRPENIARTEVVRLANQGLLDVFKQNDVDKKRWISAISDRTCEYCLALDGQIRNINELFNSPIGNVQAPGLHNMCRCSIISE